MLLKPYQPKEQDCAVWCAWPLNRRSLQTLKISTGLPRMLPSNCFELIFPVRSSIQGFLFQSCNHIFLFFMMHHKVSGLWEMKDGTVKYGSIVFWLKNNNFNTDCIISLMRLWNLWCFARKAKTDKILTISVYPRLVTSRVKAMKYWSEQLTVAFFQWTGLV